MAYLVESGTLTVVMGVLILGKLVLIGAFGILLKDNLTWALRNFATKPELQQPQLDSWAQNNTSTPLIFSFLVGFTKNISDITHSWVSGGWKEKELQLRDLKQEQTRHLNSKVRWVVGWQIQPGSDFAPSRFESQNRLLNRWCPVWEGARKEDPDAETEREPGGKIKGNYLF